MRYGLVILAGALGVLGLVFPASAATCELRPKLVDTPPRPYRSGPPDWPFRIVRAQRVSMRSSLSFVVKDGKLVRSRTNRDGSNDPAFIAFTRAVRKEPPKYVSKRPFRGVVRLGDRDYGFVLDTLEPNARGYALLYFDRNGNGDLTDDGLVESDVARQYREMTSSAHKLKSEADRLAACTEANFPRVEMEIEVESRPVRSAFFPTAYSYSSPAAEFTSAVYFEGQLRLDGKMHRLALVDFNSNGRFDDCTSLDNAGEPTKPDAVLLPTPGDMLYIDPPEALNEVLIHRMTGPDCRHHVARILCLEGRYYDLNVNPSGDRLTLQPSDVTVGYVTYPVGAYGAMVEGEPGIIKIKGAPGQRVPLPIGRWRLLNYAIDLTETTKGNTGGSPVRHVGVAEAGAVQGRGEPKVVAQPGPAAQRKLAAPKYTFAVAMMTAAVPPIDVRKGQTVRLTFGPPYRPRVHTSGYNRSRDTLSVYLTAAGSLGEDLTHLIVDGEHPPKPKIRILDPEGAVVHEGCFEWG